MLQKNTTKSITIWVITILLLGYFGHNLWLNFEAHTHVPLDGDFVYVTHPRDSYKKILDHPFGFPAIFNGEEYPATNRYFAHYIFREYALGMPLFLQKWFSPIDSIYLSIAILKILSISLIIYLLSVITTGKFMIFNFFNVFLYAFFISFVLHGKYYHHYGLIDYASTYAFNYTTGFIFLLIYYLPITFILIYNKNIKYQKLLYLFVFLWGILTTLSTPLNSPLILIISGVILFYYLIKLIVKKEKIIVFCKKNSFLIFFLITSLLFAGYSILLGTYNSENIWSEPKPLSEKFELLTKGIHKMLFGKREMQNLLIWTLFLTLLFYKFGSKARKNLFPILLFSLVVCYIFLLPYGGYRPYRPLILRRDTFAPIFLTILLLNSYLGYQLIKTKKRLLQFIVYIGLIYNAYSFERKDFGHVTEGSNQCEKTALKTLQKTTEKFVYFPGECSILAWGYITEHENSELVINMLVHYQVIKDPDLRFINHRKKRN
ncbi:MAG: hypothetical protein N4A45_09990 [Flavobacteriales bacterium]|jgi:hypothetical protein|nr:hypothetical protein [Flavobacteriales bacterium]